MHDSYTMGLRSDHPRSSSEGMLLGLAVIGMASQQPEISYDCQLILFKPRNGCQMKMTFFHAQRQLDSASVQVKWIYITDSDTFSTQESHFQA